MPHTPFNQAQQEQIIAALFRREENRSIIENHHVSERQLRRITHNLKTHGTFHAPSTKKMGRPTCLNQEVEDDLRQYVASQPLALLGDMQKYLQEKYNIKCSRASLSRRIREMGYTRGIIRRGFRSEDRQVPDISPADMVRIMRNPPPNDEMMDLPPNAKKARYAWLLHGQKPEKKSKAPRKKPTETVQDDAVATGPVDPAIMQTEPEQLPQEHLQTQHQQSLHSNNYSQTLNYLSPYRQVASNGGLAVSGQEIEPGQNMG